MGYQMYPVSLIPERVSVLIFLCNSKQSRVATYWQNDVHMQKKVTKNYLQPH